MYSLDEARDGQDPTHGSRLAVDKGTYLANMPRIPAGSR